MSREETEAITNVRSSIGAVAVLLGSMAILILGNGLQGTLIGVRAGLEGMAAESIGVVMSAYFLGYVLGSIFSPRLVKHVGHIRTFAALASIASAVSLAYLLFISPLTWALLRIVQGACYAGLALVVESWLNGSADSSHRGRVLAIYSMIVLGAWAGSQMLLNLAPPTGFTLFFVVSILFSMGLVPITLARVGTPGMVTTNRLNLRQLYSVSPLGVVGVFASGLSMSAYWGMGPTFAQQIGLDSGGISAFMATVIIGALVWQWPLGWLSDKMDRRPLIIVGAVANALAALGIAWSVDQPLWLLLALAFLFGGFGMPVYAMCVAHANDHIGGRDFVAAASGLILLYGIGAAIGPLAASLTMGHIGPAGVFLYAGAIRLAYVLFALYRMTQRGAVSRQVKKAFIAVPRATSHAVFQLYTRRRR